MKRLFFGVLVVFSLAVVAHGVQINQRSHVSTKTTPLFGAETMQFGINAHSGQVGTEAIFAYTYSQGQSFSVGGHKYAVPDQLSVSADNTQNTVACENLETNFSSVFDAYKGQYSFANGGGNDQKAFSGASQHSEELLKIKAFLHSHSQSDVEYGFSTYTENIYSLDFGPAFILQPNPNWKKLVEALPKTISSTADRELYLKFVEKCGTHYVANGVFGGSVHTVTFVNKTVIDKYGGTEVVLQMTDHFQNYLNEITGKTTLRRTRDSPRRLTTLTSSNSSWFSADTTTYDFVHGGNTTLAKEGKDWLATVDGSPALVKSSLLSLSALLTFDPTRQATLESFIKSYINGEL